MDDKVTGTAKITMESMLWMGPTFVIKRNAKLQLEVSKIEDISPLICAHDPLLERPVKERFLDSQLLKSPAHDHGPLLVFHLPAGSFSATTSAFLPLPEHAKQAAASGPLPILVPLLELLFLELYTWLPPSLLLGPYSNVTLSERPSLATPGKEQQPLSLSIHTPSSITPLLSDIHTPLFLVFHNSTDFVLFTAISSALGAAHTRRL